jgi:hypothetical protein
MLIVFSGVDLAKNLFEPRGVNEAGKPELMRSAVGGVAELSTRTIGMEARPETHHRYKNPVSPEHEIETRSLIGVVRMMVFPQVFEAGRLDRELLVDRRCFVYLFSALMQEWMYIPRENIGGHRNG